MTKFKIEAFAGLCMLAMAIVAGHAISNAPVSGNQRPAASSVAPYEMMISAGQLPDQPIDALF